MPGPTQLWASHSQGMPGPTQLWAMPPAHREPEPAAAGGDVTSEQESHPSPHSAADRCLILEETIAELRASLAA